MRRFDATVIACGLLLGAAGVLADGNAEARFRGTGKADPIRIANVRWTAGPVAGQSTIAFDLAWDHSWRAAWKVGERQHGGKGTLKLENWDAAWVFVKFRKPGDDAFSHATLSIDRADWRVPAGVALDVGLSDDGKRGLGVFVYRGAPGHGPNNWKGVTLRWLHGADGIAKPGKVFAAASHVSSQTRRGGRLPGTGLDVGDPFGADDSALGPRPDRVRTAPKGAVEVRIFAVRMVYVPQCAFWLGDGSTSHVTGQFSAGDTTESFRMESEEALTLGGTSRKNLGNRDGIGVRRPEDFGSAGTQTLPPRFPKGYGAFYCMKHELTQGQYVEFLNTLSAGRQAELSLAGMPEQRCRIRGVVPTKPATSGKPAVPTVFETDTPLVPCAYIGWTDATAYSAWAGLRPMTELEFEKACRGPLKPVPDEYAWGTAGIVGGINTPTVKYQPVDRYTLRGAGQPDERVAWKGRNGPDATRGNAIWDGSARPIRGPVRAGIFATPDSGRVAAGASYWGIMELSGSLAENAVTVGCDAGRRFAGTHGNGTLSRPGDWRFWGEGVGFGTRGGYIDMHPPSSRTGTPLDLRTADRKHVRFAFLNRAPLRDHQRHKGLRCVRTADTGRTPVAPPPDESTSAQRMFNDRPRITNVMVAPRDAKTAAVRFDITWDESWRNATNHDAAWVFFKVRAEGAGRWQHLRLAADKVLNPTGYGHGEGTPVDLIVPAGDDGFTGVFVRRAADGKGTLSARRVTAIWDLAANKGIRDIGKAQIQAFGIEMVYVAEGPFYLGSGGTEPNRFYKYTDGSQNRLPHRVTGPGAIATGPQSGRLWATGAAPDASDAGEIPAAFPNGYRPFYCMKDSVSQGQFYGLLSMHPEIKVRPAFRRTGRYPVRQPGWEGSMAFAALTGLRPMTELEFEKACRGPREPVPNEARPSYWGIRQLNEGGVIESAVSAGHAAGGLTFAGTHGRGVLPQPADWPGLGVRGAGRSVRVGGHNGFVRTSDRQCIQVRAYGMEERIGFRCVRTAPPEARQSHAPDASGKRAPRALFALGMDPLPDLRGPDISIFYLSGRFRNGGDRALKVQLTSPLPDACFPEGAASRTFTASPKAGTAFRILTVLTVKAGRAARTGQVLPVRVGMADGKALAEQKIPLPMADPLAVKPPVIGTVDGGTVRLRIANTTDRPHAVMLEMPPLSGIKIPQAKRRVQVASGSTTQVSFRVRSHGFGGDRFCRMPYRAAIADGAPQEGETAAEMHVQSRWWISPTAPSLKTPRGGSGKPKPEQDMLHNILEEGGLADDSVWAPPPSLFKATKPPRGWKTVTHGAGLWLGHLDPPPSGGGILQAATRVTAPAEREAIIKVGRENASYVWLDDALLQDRRGGKDIRMKPVDVLRKRNPAHFVGRVLFNGEVVYDSRARAKLRRKPVRIRKSGNTMLVQCRMNEERPPDPGDLFVLFYGAKDGKRLRGLVFDVDER